MCIPGCGVKVRLSTFEQLPSLLGQLREEVLTVTPLLQLVGSALRVGGAVSRATTGLRLTSVVTVRSPYKFV